MSTDQLILPIHDLPPRIFVRRCRCGQEFETQSKRRQLCRDCGRESMAKYRNSHRQSNPPWREKVCPCGKTYKTKSYSRSRCSSCHAEHQRQYRGSVRGTLSFVYNTCKGSKNHRGEKREFNIDFEYVVSLWESQGGRCALTGAGMSVARHDLKRVSLDRKDSSKGYVLGNVQLVCMWANLAKRNRPDSEFLAIIDELRGKT